MQRGPCGAGALVVGARSYRWRHQPEIRQFPTWSYFAIVLGGSTATYLAAMAVDVEREKSRRRSWLLSQRLGWNSSRLSSSGRMQRQDTIVGLDILLPSRWRAWWASRAESERTILALIALNSSIFAAWKVPFLRSFMSRYFLHSTRSHPVTLLTSTFSHATGLHLLFNMMALYSFGRLLHDKMGREQFLAFYLTSGLAASAGSHALRAWRGETTKSLGASGAVFSVAAACAHQPQISVSLIFLPFVPVPISMALPAMMVYDAAGVVNRWSTFDHAAHLSGAIFGYVYYTISTRHLWPRRHHILQSLGYPIK